MNDYVDYLKGLGFAKKTMCYYDKVVEEFNQSFNQSTYNDIMEYVGIQQSKGLTAISIKNKINALRHYFEMERKQGVRKDNPCQYVKIQGSRKTVISYTLTNDEMKLIYELYDSNIGKRVALGLMLFQGLTANDFKELYSTDIELNKGVVRVQESKRTNARVLELEAVQMIDLIKYLQGMGEERLFTCDLHYLVYSICVSVTKTHGIKINNNIIRTSRILYWLKHHAITEVQYMTGFKYLSSLEKYRQMDTESLKEELERYFMI